MFRKMNVMQINNFLTERGVSVKGYDKCSLINIASAVERMGIPCVPNAIGGGFRTGNLFIYLLFIKKFNTYNSIFT